MNLQFCLPVSFINSSSNQPLEGLGKCNTVQSQIRCEGRPEQVVQYLVDHAKNVSLASLKIHGLDLGGREW